jgi:c-di-GMP-binding flagellar brake protein YcgR
MVERVGLVRRAARRGWFRSATMVAMSDIKAELFPERVEIEVIDGEPRVTTMGAMLSFSERGLVLRVDDSAAVAAFPSGTKVRGSYGDHSGFCRFDSEVVESSAGATPEEPSLIRLEPPARISTTQRRRYVRAGVELTIPVALLDTKQMTFLSAPGDVANLGGGGLMMIIAAHPSLVVGSKLALAIPIPGSDPVLALGRTVQVVLEPGKPATVRLAFTSIDAGDRERIERFAYRKVGGTAPAKLWASGKITATQPSPQ